MEQGIAFGEWLCASLDGPVESALDADGHRRTRLCSAGAANAIT
jgi:hypothetical protein